MLVWTLFLLALYFLPFAIAQHRGALAIGTFFFLNLLFGWTVIGWLWLLADALTCRTRRDLDRLYGRFDDAS